MNIHCTLWKTFFISLFLIPASYAADLDYYFGKDVAFNEEIPSPEGHLGYQVGDWHVRPEQLTTYMQALAHHSDRVQIETIGYTHERRPLLHLTISSPENLARIDEIRKHHLAIAAGEAEPKGGPVVIWMGYSVHGNEASGSNAAPLMAYYLAAAQGIDEMLQNVVVIFDPTLNPDGLTRFASWVNANKGQQLVAEDGNRENNEPWPGGRTNHYWFDLNRDWLLLVQPESRARVARFHAWRPNILTDHHEMGSDSTFFFQPGIPSRQNPLTPTENLDLTRMIARYHAEAFDAHGELYYSEQNFDDYYYGKGSTYPDIQGCIGILFEQASSRGHLKMNSFGPLPFSATIKNQLTSSLSTLKAGYENRINLLEWQYNQARKNKQKAARDDVKGYVFAHSEDPQRALEMAQNLAQHQIEVYRLGSLTEINGRPVEQGFVVPTNQPQYLLIKSLFEIVDTFNDKSFYDVSTWHFPSAFGVDYRPLTKIPSGMLGERADLPAVRPGKLIEKGGGAYAYAFSWASRYAPRAAYKLLDAGLKPRFATLPFQSEVNGATIGFKRGTIVIPMGTQTLPRAEVESLLKRVAEEDGVTVYGLETGLTPSGIDLGSDSLQPLKKPVVAMMVGTGFDPASSGSIWHLLDDRMEIPLTLFNWYDRWELKDYSHLIIPSNRYMQIPDDVIAKIKSWVEAGGSLIVLERSIPWAITKELVSAEMQKGSPPSENDKGEETPEEGARKPFGDRATDRSLHLISGTAFQGHVDITHPLAYGVLQPQVTFFRNHTQYMNPSKDPYATVVQYTDTPLVSGYVSEKNLEKLKGSAAIIGQNKGKGRIVLIADPPNFRGYWISTNKFFLNGLFFSSAM